LLTIALVGAWAVTFRPRTLGGPASFVGVNGISMTPTMHNGDVAVTEDKSTYHVGDVIAYRIPAGTPGAGHNIIHRIVGGDALNGYNTKGDHNTWVDIWHPKPSDIVGKVWFRVPGGLNIIKRLRSPQILAGLVGSLTFMAIVWPSKGKQDVDAAASQPVEQGEPQP
jgi:signal peptidase I